MTLPLDAREVLTSLNELGYRNITAEQLKEFMQDLRKLIKYEERLCVFNKENHEKIRNYENSDNLHKAHTISFKAKTATADLTKCKKITKDDRKSLQKKSILSGINANVEKKGSIEEKQTVINDVQSRPSRKTISQSDKLSRPESRMWIRPKSATRQQRIKTKDPVELYQYYQKEWERFKQNLPGENDHMELRWKIRHKLLGANND